MKQGPYTAGDFQRDTGVSRETRERLQIYGDLLLEWSGRMNLVAKSTLPDLWHRHMYDSAQVYPLLPPESRVLVDLGSGAGFPGLVLAIMGVPEVHLIESTGKKCGFLRAVIEATGASATVHNGRIEEAPAFAADVITARALASLDKLLGLAQRFDHGAACHIYLKGQHVEDELTRAHKIWKMRTDRRPSLTDPRGSVLCVREVSRVQSRSNHSPSSPPV